MREDRASHLSPTLPWCVDSLEQFPLLSCAGRQIVKFILCAQLEWRHKIDPPTNSSSKRNKTLLKLMNHLVCRTRSFTPASSSPGGGGGGGEGGEGGEGGGEGSYGRMTRRGSLSCPSLLQGKSHPALSIIEKLKTLFKEMAKMDRRSALVFQKPNISSCLVSLDCE